MHISCSRLRDSSFSSKVAVATKLDWIYHPLCRRVCSPRDILDVATLIKGGLSTHDIDLSSIFLESLGSKFAINKISYWCYVNGEVVYSRFVYNGDDHKLFPCLFCATRIAALPCRDRGYLKRLAKEFILSRMRNGVLNRCYQD